MTTETEEKTTAKVKSPAPVELADIRAEIKSLENVFRKFHEFRGEGGNKTSVRQRRQAHVLATSHPMASQARRLSISPLDRFSSMR